MSRELLKRVIAECSDEGSRSNVSTDLYCEIAEYLEMPEPKPVAFVSGGTVNWIQPQAGVLKDKQPLYASPPDQLAQIAALKHELQQADEDYVAVEEVYLQCQKDLYDETEKLAALQARDPVLLNEDEINEMVCDYSQTNIWEFARLLEQAVLKANGFKGEV